MSIASKHAYRFQFLRSEAWSNVRLEALAREKGKCEICGEESIYNDAHHIWYPENIYQTKAYQLAVLCRPCHEFLHIMLPECKTKEQWDGTEQWLRYKNAIIAWRLSKLHVFEASPEIKTERELELFNSHSIVTEIMRIKAKLNGRAKGDVISISKKELGEMFTGLKKFKMQP